MILISYDFGRHVTYQYLWLIDTLPMIGRHVTNNWSARYHIDQSTCHQWLIDRLPYCSVDMSPMNGRQNTILISRHVTNGRHVIILFSRHGTNSWNVIILNSCHVTNDWSTSHRRFVNMLPMIGRNDWITCYE